MIMIDSCGTVHSVLYATNMKQKHTHMQSQVQTLSLSRILVYLEMIYLPHRVSYFFLIIMHTW